jgi:pimeloyl-ACP methyl ester carboxylesterase
MTNLNTPFKKPILLFLLITALLFKVNAQTVKPMETLKKAGHAPVNGLQMYYEIHGEGGIPLVLIHGGGSTIESTFGPTLPLLAAHGKVIAVELQAHGRTSDRDAPESFAQDADDVAALLKYLKVDKANIFGFSNGGSTALQMAIRHPEVVNKIIAASAAYRRDGLIPGFFESMPKATLSVMPQALQNAFLKVNPDKNKLLVMFNKDKQRMIDFKDWPDADFAGIKASTLIIATDHDVITVEHTVKMSRLIPGAQLIILPGNHGAFMGAAESGIARDSKLPAITVALIEDFLNEK